MPSKEENRIETPKVRTRLAGMLTLFVLAHWGHHLLSSSVPPLLPFIRSSLNIDVAQAGGLVSAFTIAYGVSQLPAGWLADRIGRRALIALGVSGAALCGFLLGIAPTYGMMVTLMVLMGLFGGGYHPASAPLVTSLVEPKRRGWALGIHQIGGTASNLSAPLIAAALASSYLGWKSAFMIPGAVVFVLGIVLYLLTGADRQTVKAPVSAGGHGKVEPPEPQHSRSNLITYLTIGTFGQVFIGSVISFLPLFIVDRLGESAAIGAALQAVVYLGGLPAGPLAGYFADRVGPRRMLIVAGVVTGPVIYLLTQVTSVWTSIPIFLSLGALMFVLMPVSEIYLINQTPETNRSTAMGVYYACSRGGSGFLILGVGYLIKHLGFSPTFAITGIALLVIVVACLVFLWYQRKSALVNKV